MKIGYVTKYYTTASLRPEEKQRKKELMIHNLYIFYVFLFHIYAHCHINITS